MTTVNLLPVTAWKHTPFIADWPLSIVLMLVLSPAQVALVKFVGTLDPKELKREITPTRALYNHSQVALSGFIGSVVAHAVGHPAKVSPLLLPVALLSLAAAALTNVTLVTVGVSVDRGYAPFHVLRRMLVGNPRDYVLTVLLVALSGGAISGLYGHSKPLALLAALSISLLSRQTLSRSQMVVDTGRAYRSREQALQQVSDEIRHERTDERRLIAAELHDEVLQPLFKVTLMAHVLKADLAGGRLLDLDQDVPELLTAADLASTTLRELIGDLRRSALSRGGLAPALQRSLQLVAEHAPSRLHVQIGPAEVDADVELVIYQIAKEAVANSLSHSRAENIWVTLRQHTERVELIVSDDGIGFDATIVPEGHYGLHIMRERASAVGADLSLESTSGQGATLTLSIHARQQRPRPN